MNSTSEASAMLSREHEKILAVAGAMEREAAKLEKKGIDADFFRQAIDFIRNYADKLHHAKEEDLLFKEINKCADDGCLHCNPVTQMLLEHDHGRDCVAMMEKGLNEKNKKSLAEGARGYAALIREHIFKEDNILYPMGDQAFSDETKASLLKQFKQIDKTRAKELAHYEKFADEVAQR